MMTNIILLPPSGKSSVKSLTGPLELAEAERSAFLKFRIHRRAFRKRRSLAGEIVMLKARDAWVTAYHAMHGSVA